MNNAELVEKIQQAIVRHTLNEYGEAKYLPAKSLAEAIVQDVFVEEKSNQTRISASYVRQVTLEFLARNDNSFPLESLAKNVVMIISGQLSPSENLKQYERFATVAGWTPPLNHPFRPIFDFILSTVNDMIINGELAVDGHWNVRPVSAS